MKKIIFLIPVFNDWESLSRLIGEIDDVISSEKNFNFECIVVNDSSTINQPNIIKPPSFKSIKILNMKINKGHARCNAFGLRHINLNKTFDYVIVMDSDGEDRPIEIKDLIDKIKEVPDISVVAKRIKRSEGPIFQFLYQLHKLMTIIFTGKKINFGNYSCLTKKDVDILHDKASLWSSFSGSVKKNVTKLNEVNSIRGLRYFGPSKMSLINLIIHSFSIIGVFKYIVIFRSILIILALSLIFNQSVLVSSIQVFILIFNVLIFIVSLRENENALIQSKDNISKEIEVSQ